MSAPQIRPADGAQEAAVDGIKPDRPEKAATSARSSDACSLGAHEQARVAVFVSGGGTNLQALLDAEAAGAMSHAHIALVISNKPGVGALDRAARAGVESRVITRADYASKAEQEEAMVRAVEGARIDVIVLAGFLQILSESFTSRFAGRILNIHPSLIPSFCGEGMYGLKVHEAALAAGVKLTGATVHYVNEIPDGGQIIAQKAVEVHGGDTPESLQQRVMEEAEWVLLPRATELVAQRILAERS